MKGRSCWLLTLMLTSTAAQADFGRVDGIWLGSPTSGGTGCPAGTASAAASPDGSSVSILFDQYEVRAGGMTGKTMDRKTCDIVIPMTLPQGYSVSILAIDYRGFNNLPRGAQSRFDVEYFFAGSHGPGFTKNFYGDLSDNFLIHNNIAAESTVWSSCGASVNLRTNTALLVQTNRMSQEALASVDSADVSASVVYQLQWRRCDGNTPFPNPFPAPPPPGGGLDQPDPGHYQGNCIIDTHMDQFGRTSWFVRDIFQDLIARASSYEEAVAIAEQSDMSGRCMGQDNGGGYYPPNPRPRPAPPTPRPEPWPGRQQISCQIRTPAGVFFGVGPNQGSAIADARNRCIRQTNNARVCMTGSIACRR
jgi:hypothetical protein